MTYFPPSPAAQQERAVRLITLLLIAFTLAAPGCAGVFLTRS
jgi:hypothetical protein